LRLQGFPENYKIVVPYSSIKKQTGNTVAVPVIKAVAEEMVKSLKLIKNEVGIMSLKEEAKSALDDIIKKGRVHLYKPIQIAEILYFDRVNPGELDLLSLEDYRTNSKKWRDKMTKILVGNVSTSSAKFQDDIFNAMPPRLLNELGIENRRTKGAVEAYVYRRFLDRFTMMSKALDYALKSTKDNFCIKTFIEMFWREPGLKRSVDKVFEIIVYSLFTTLVSALDLMVTISVSAEKIDILEEFSDFAKFVMALDTNNLSSVQNAKVYRVGVTNAADRGLDMYSNWGPAIQIKHLSLKDELAENIVTGVASDKIVIVCKDADEGIILSLLTQIGWKSKIQSIITESDLVSWYEKALRGVYSEEIGDELLSILCNEIVNEFPSTEEATPQILKSRNYQDVNEDFWT